jgi:hypothetical protein
LFRLGPALSRWCDQQKQNRQRKRDVPGGLIYADNSRASVQGKCQTDKPSWSYRFCPSCSTVRICCTAEEITNSVHPIIIIPSLPSVLFNLFISFPLGLGAGCFFLRSWTSTRPAVSLRQHSRPRAALAA